MEQAGQFAGSIASRAGGAALGGAVAGPAGAIAGGLAAPALFEGAQQLGPIALERARNNGREEPNLDDWKWAAATAATSGAANAVAPGGSGMGRRMVLEGATETGQEFIQQAGSTAGIDKGLTLDPKEAIGAGILGAGSAGVVDSAIKGVQTVADTKGNIERLRWDGLFGPEVGLCHDRPERRDRHACPQSLQDRLKERQAVVTVAVQNCLDQRVTLGLTAQIALILCAEGGFSVSCFAF